MLRLFLRIRNYTNHHLQQYFYLITKRQQIMDYSMHEIGKEIQSVEEKLLSSNLPPKFYFLQQLSFLCTFYIDVLRQ